MATTNQDTKVITGECRLSYVHVFEPFRMNEKDDFKYSVMLLIPKSDTETYENLRTAEKAAAQAGIGKLGGSIPKRLASIIKDGDDEEFTDPDKNPERVGHWYMTVSSASRPGIVDQNVQDIIDSTAVYSGCYARASINAYAYDYNGKKGVTFGLNHLQKLRDGDFLGGRTRAEDDFDVVSADLI